MEEKETVNVALACVDGEHKGEIPVQQRAEIEIDPKTGVEKMQSSPYVLQLTFGGKVDKEDKRSLEQAIKRECEEELGEKFAKRFDFSSLKLFHKGEFEYNGRTFKSYSYFGTLTTSQYNLINLHSAAEKIVWVKEPDLRSIEPLDKSNPSQNPQTTLVMFADFLEALRTLYDTTQYAKFLI